MAPLEGHTLGQRHKYYNHLVREAIANRSADLTKINYNEDDIDNMIKIDIACHERRVEYILAVLKYDDMLYVSRAINKSSWIIKEAQYKHIINPHYLHKTLFPNMNNKSINKLMLHIRRLLKDEIRVKAFYFYVKQKDPKAALNWLPNCPVKLIEKVVRVQADDIPKKLLIRLCRRSMDIFRIYKDNYSQQYNLYEKFNDTLPLLNTNAKLYLNVLETYSKHNYFKFNKKYTRVLMKKCPQKIIDEFSKYCDRIDMKSFVACLKYNEIQPFLVDRLRTDASVWKYEILMPFLEKIPRENVLHFLKILSNVKRGKDDTEHSGDMKCDDLETLFNDIENDHFMCFDTIYRWYQFAPFDLAFRNMKKLIDAESSSAERNNMLLVVLNSAKNDIQNVNTVLLYYIEKHINEPYTEKIQFVNNVLSQHETYRWSDSMWNTLNKIFHALEVFIESKNNVDMCIISVIMHHILRDQPVPDIIDQKFYFQTLKHLRNKLDDTERRKVFDYLYSIPAGELLGLDMDSEPGIHTTIDILHDIKILLDDWKPESEYYQLIIDKIVECSNIYKSSSWAREIHERQENTKKGMSRRKQRKLMRNPYINIPAIYTTVKLFRRDLFEHSLVLHPCEEVCLNALKHDPGLLVRNKCVVDALRCDKHVSLQRFHRKLKVYWTGSLATEWSNRNIQSLHNVSWHSALVQGLFVLLPHEELMQFINMYVPEQKKIDWNEADETKLSLQKYIAKNMHLARPQLPLRVALWFAKGDYLQSALLSLNSMLHNLRASDIQKYLNKLLKAPVSLQKHGIRVAFVKLNAGELIRESPIIWKSTTNPSIRNVLFISVFNLLCKKKKSLSAKKVWAILSSFIDNLNDEEHKTVYETMQNVRGVPTIVIGECFEKCFLFLKSLHCHTEPGNMLEDLLKYAPECIQYLNSEFVEKSLLLHYFGSIGNLLNSNNDDKWYLYMNILLAYLLNSKNADIQNDKYNNLIGPAVESCFRGLQKLLTYICYNIPKYVIDRKMVMPTEIVRNMQHALEKHHQQSSEWYTVLVRWRLSVAYIELLDSLLIESNRMLSWYDLRAKSVQGLATIFAQQLTEDSRNIFPSVYMFYTAAMDRVLNDFGLSDLLRLNILEALLHNSELPQIYIFVIKTIPQYFSDSFDKTVRDTKIGDICRKICSHPSLEVKMHYRLRYSDKYSKSYHIPDNTYYF